MSNIGKGDLSGEKDKDKESEGIKDNKFIGMFSKFQEDEMAMSSDDDDDERKKNIRLERLGKVTAIPMEEVQSPDQKQEDSEERNE